MVAYASGNAANSAPPKVISHTSLPSQIGPIELMKIRRSWSVRASGCRMPTPRSNPSSIAYPARRTPRRMNQMTCKSIVGSGQFIEVRRYWAKTEIRHPKHEIRNEPEYPNPKSETRALRKDGNRFGHL